MQLQNQTCSAPQACTTAAWGLLALLPLPFLQSCTFVYLLSSNLYQSYHCTYFYKVSCASPAPHLNSCTSTPAPHLVHLYACTFTRAPHLVHLYACTAPRAHQVVHLYACT